MNKTRIILERLTSSLRALLESKDLTVVLFIITIIAIIIVPLPGRVLDFLLTISIALSVLIILISLYIKKPTDFSSFPTLLLIVTLYRLALNVATTRMILSKGYEGPEQVSDIIASFGQFVVGGNYVIGAIVFTILVLVNLLVITNGSTRVTEVRARFILDAMPGKQMAIDADLNSGLIDQDEAKERRDNLAAEADFYGSLDGASKFVKGDAIAGIVITLINIIGGFLIGVFQYHLSISDSASTFTILTIGDGLVGQIPALIIATATGIVATRTTQTEGDDNFAARLVSQLTHQSKILFLVGGILILFALVPGLPTLSLGFVGLLFLFIGWVISLGDDESVIGVIKGLLGKKTTPRELASIEEENIEDELPQKSAAELKAEEEDALKAVLNIEMLELKIGYELITLADKRQGGMLLDYIKQQRKKIASDLGFIMPQVRIRDDLQLVPSNKYELLLKNVVIGSGEVMPNKILAMATGMMSGDPIPGIAVKEPVFGIDAIWIDPSDKEEAIMQNYTIVDPSAIIGTHISELVKEYAKDFITKDEVKKMLDRQSERYPEMIAEANKMPINTIRAVLQALLEDLIPINDMLTILETITDFKEYASDVPLIVEQVRANLSRTITQLNEDEDGVVKFVIFEQSSEQALLNNVHEGILLLNIANTQELKTKVEELTIELANEGISPLVIVCDTLLRRPLSVTLKQYQLRSVVLSHAELDINAKAEIVGTISLDMGTSEEG